MPATVMRKNTSCETGGQDHKSAGDDRGDGTLEESEKAVANTAAGGWRFWGCTDVDGETGCAGELADQHAVANRNATQAGQVERRRGPALQTHDHEGRGVRQTRWERNKACPGLQVFFPKDQTE